MKYVTGGLKETEMIGAWPRVLTTELILCQYHILPSSSHIHKGMYEIYSGPQTLDLELNIFSDKTGA